MTKSLGVAFAAAVMTATTPAFALKFNVVCDHADFLCRCGDEAVFTVTALETNGVKATSGIVNWSLDRCGDTPFKNGEVDLAKGNPFNVRGTLDKPGFMRMKLTAAGCKPNGLAGGWCVGFEPEHIRKASPSPDDFDEFWADGRKRLAAEVPLDVRIEPYPEKSSAYWDYHRISFATFGRRIYGFLSTPKDKTRRYPARMQVASAGWGNWTNFQPGKKNMVFLWFSVYPFEPSWDWQTDGTTKKYGAMNAACRKKWGWGGYSTAGISGKREDFFFYSVILGLDRAADWLAGHPLVKPGDMTYFGGSQSGGLGLALVAINHKFRKAAMTVPGMTDVMAHLDGRRAAWPRAWEDAPAAEKAAVDANLPYYDAANFASRIKCPVRLTVGFRDALSQPPCVYAAYNEIKVADKAILHAVDSGHGMPDRMHSDLARWLSEK